MNRNLIRGGETRNMLYWRQKQTCHGLTCFISVASNQRRIPGSLYTVVKVVRSIHMDLNMNVREEKIQDEPLVNIQNHDITSFNKVPFHTVLKESLRVVLRRELTDTERSKKKKKQANQEQ